jgi:hypothetical protein
MGRAWWGAIFAVLIVATASCSSTPPSKPQPSADITDARPIAREIATILLNFAVYDYAVVGGINGERVRVVDVDRYVTIARAQAQVINNTVPTIIAEVIDTTGPVHDRLVALADSLAVLRQDALAYADARNADALARILADVETNWSLLRNLQSLLKDDGNLDRIIERGTSVRTVATPGTRALVTIGPFAGAAEAAEIAKEFGPAGSAATESPFVVRITFPDRASAEEKAKDLQKHGIPAIVIDQTSFAFTRTGTPPDGELWREPERFIDTHGGARRVALSGDAGLVATGSDDGFIAVFTNDGVLRALPKFNAGVNQLVFTDNGGFLFGGGQVLQNWVMPRPTIALGEPMRLTDAPISALYVPRANMFAASSDGIIGARAPDGQPLRDFPIFTGDAGAILAASDVGELFIGVQVAQGFEVRVLRVGQTRFPAGILRVPGVGRAFAVDRTGTFGAAVTDQGTYRFNLKAVDPTRTITRVTPTARDVEFGSDGSLYVMEAQRVTAVSIEGNVRWTQQIVDGRRLAVGLRPVVLDGTNRLVTFALADGVTDSLAPVGDIQDLVVSKDGRWVGVIADARRAVLFRLQ